MKLENETWRITLDINEDLFNTVQKYKQRGFKSNSAAAIALVIQGAKQEGLYEKACECSL